MKTVCIIQARLASTRLPAKVLLPLPTGRTVLEEVVWRCRQIEGVDAVCVAIPDDEINWMMLSPVLFRTNVTRIYRGPEKNVLLRFDGAMQDSLGRCFGSRDLVMRITSDCPLLNPEMCGDMLKYFKQHSLEYLSNAWPIREVPHGWDCEIFSAWRLHNARYMAETDYDREHVTPTIQRYVKKSGKYAVWKDMRDRSHLRWTLDTLDDYIRIWKIFEDQIAADPSLRAA